MNTADDPTVGTTTPEEGTRAGSRARARHAPIPVRRLVAGALAIEVASFVLTIRALSGTEAGTRVFWFAVSVVWLYRILRGGQLSWALTVAFGVLAGGTVFVAAADAAMLSVGLLLLVQVGALVARPVREHVGVARDRSSRRRVLSSAR